MAINNFCKLRNILLLFCIFFVGMVSSKENPQSAYIKILIKQECKLEFYGLPFDSNEKNPDYVLWDSSRAKSLIYKDSRTSILFYVESDGKHLVAIGKEDNLLWARNPFEESGLCPYRTPRPVINRMESFDISRLSVEDLNNLGVDKSHKFLMIYFDSSQFGLIDELTGDFFFLGQN